MNYGVDLNWKVLTSVKKCQYGDVGIAEVQNEGS